jgi:hypothetical protein
VLEHWPCTEETVAALRKAEVVPTLVLLLEDASGGDDMRSRMEALKREGFYYDQTRECKLEVCTCGPNTPDLYVCMHASMHVRMYMYVCVCVCMYPLQ